MKRILPSPVSVAILITILPSASHAQWIRTAGPEGDYVFSLAPTGAKVCASSTGGVLVSIDNGTSWSFTGLTLVSVTTLLATEMNLYAGIHWSALTCVRLHPELGGISRIRYLVATDPGSQELIVASQ